MWRTSPMAPARICSMTARWAGLNRIHIASMRKRSWASAAPIIRSTSRALSAIGFSTSTCFPASRKRTASSM